MFDFEKLDLYQEIRGINALMMKWVQDHPNMDDYVAEQFKTLLIGIASKLAEGTARMGYQEKKRCYTESRVNVFECVTLLHIMKDVGTIDEERFEEFYEELDKISRMLLGMIRSQRSHRDRGRDRGYQSDSHSPDQSSGGDRDEDS